MGGWISLFALGGLDVHFIPWRENKQDQSRTSLTYDEREQHTQENQLNTQTVCGKKNYEARTSMGQVMVVEIDPASPPETKLLKPPLLGVFGLEG